MSLKHIALRCFVAVIAALAGADCSGGDLTLPSEGLAAKIAIASGNAQNATVSSVLPANLVVRVTDSRDQPVPNQPVDFAVTGGGGSVSPASATTGADGLAGTRWTLGPTAGAQAVSARATGNGAPPNLSVTFSASALTAVPAKLAKVAGDNQNASAGAPVTTPPSVKITDADDNPIEGVLVTFAVTGGGGTVEPTMPVRTGPSGVAAVTSWRLGSLAGPNQLTATVSATGIAGNPAVFNAMGRVGGANRLVFIVPPVNAAVGAPITPAVQVQVQDAAGNPVTSATNEIRVTLDNAGGGSLGGTTSVAAVAGIATFANLTVSKVGTGYTLTAFAPQTSLISITSTPFDVVNASSTTTISNISPNSSVVGQQYIVSFAIAAAPPASGTPTGTVTVSDGAGATCSAQAPNGSCSLTSTSAGTKSVVATYGGDGNFAGSASPAKGHQVGPAETTALITGDLPDPSIFGQAVTVSFTVTVNSPGAGTPTGNVSVTFAGTPVCQAPLSAGQCSFTPASTGNKNLKATFLPATGDFVGDASPNEGHIVDPASTSTSVTSSLNPSSFGQSVSFTATVSPEPGGATPTGAVQFKIDGSNFGSPINLSGGGTAQSQSTSSLAPGAHTAEAAYAPNTPGFTGSSGSTTQNVGGLIPTNLSLGTSPNPSTFGSAVKLTATVTSAVLTPIGSVSFFDGPCGSGISLGLDNLSGGSGTATASISVNSLGAGQHSLSACYGGNGTFGPSQDTQTQTVDQLATQTNVSSNNNPSSAGQDVTFTATVTAAVGTPDGTVTFRDGSCPDQGSDLSGAVALNGGQGQFTTSALPGGSTTTVVACYSGSTNYLGSAGAIDQVVN